MNAFGNKALALNFQKDFSSSCPIYHFFLSHIILDMKWHFSLHPVPLDMSAEGNHIKPWTFDRLKDWFFSLTVPISVISIALFCICSRNDQKIHEIWKPFEPPVVKEMLLSLCRGWEVLAEFAQRDLVLSECGVGVLWCWTRQEICRRPTAKKILSSLIPVMQ